MQYSTFKIVVSGLFIICGALWPLKASAQSRDHRFPTPVTSNEINGVIPARDIGDSRLTSYFYVFEGGQGDIFINVVTKNLSGDIDVFTADSLQPLTKIVLYADAASSETGRLIYLRKPARLILRVEGRTPNDDPASFRIKFAGSFVAMLPVKADEGPVVEHSERDGTSGVRVNSVGTIIEVIPNSKTEAKSVDTENDAPAGELRPVSADKTAKDQPSSKTKPEPDVKTVLGKRPAKSKETEKDAPATITEAENAPPRGNRKSSQPSASEAKPADPLASINLVIQMKDGGVIERPMNEVVRFSVDKGVLTVVTKDGKTSRFSILNVEKVTIQ